MIRTICIFGVGGVGGYYGGKMALAVQQGRLPERQVYFVARGQHLRRIQERGLILKYHPCQRAHMHTCPGCRTGARPSSTSGHNNTLC